MRYSRFSSRLSRSPLLSLLMVVFMLVAVAAVSNIGVPEAGAELNGSGVDYKNQPEKGSGCCQVTASDEWVVDIILPGDNEPDISITKTVTPTSAYRGDTVNYTITVENTGQAYLYNVTVVDDMLELGSDGYIGNLGVGSGPRVITKSYTIPSDAPYGDLINTATITAEYGYPNCRKTQGEGWGTLEKSATATVNVRSKPDPDPDPDPNPDPDPDPDPNPDPDPSPDPDPDPDPGPQPQPQPQTESELPEPEQEIEIPEEEIILEVPGAPPSVPSEETKLPPKLPQTGNSSYLLTGLGTLMSCAGFLLMRRKRGKDK